MKDAARVRLYLNTVRHLKAVQIRYQIKNRIAKKMEGESREACTWQTAACTGTLPDTSCDSAAG